MTWKKQITSPSYEATTAHTHYWIVLARGLPTRPGYDGVLRFQLRHKPVGTVGSWVIGMSYQSLDKAKQAAAEMEQQFEAEAGRTA